MAQKRMFDKAIIDTDKFMDLSMSAKALYFLLGMEADDEGFVSYKKVMRIHGGNEDDFKVLVIKGFLIHFESGVVVITDWNSNNYLDKNRTKETEYQKEKKQLSLTKNNKYVLNNGSTSIEESSIVQSSIEERRVVQRAEMVKGDKETFDLLESFKSVNPSYKEFNQTECDSLMRLVKQHGIDRVAEFIDILPKINTMEFAPTITTPFQLEKKLGQLIAFIGKEKNKVLGKKIVNI